MKNSFVDKYSSKIEGVLSCYDRVVLRGTLPSVSHTGAMTNLLYRKGMLLKDITKLTDPLRNELHENAKRISKSSGVAIEFIRSSKSVRKEDLVRKSMEENGRTSGLVCILSAMETCRNYRYAYDKKTGRSYLKLTSGKCLHYYFYIVDKQYGLCYLRVPTWCPFQLQFYFNAHNWLANEMDKAGIRYEQKDNTFTHISDYAAAQQLSDKLDVRQLHTVLNRLCDTYCPAYRKIDITGYHWSIMQLEYATDIVFKRKNSLGPIYDGLLKNIMHTVTPNNVAIFLGRKGVHGKNNQELDTSYKHVLRDEVRRIKHRMGSSSVKIYDKSSQVLRIETTTNNTSEFYHYRSVEHRDGTKTQKLAPVKKTIYSLKALVQIMLNCNKRYMKFIAGFDLPITGKKKLEKISKPIKSKGRSYRGFNFFDKEDANLLQHIADGNFVIKGFKSKDLKNLFPDKSSEFISRVLKRLRLKGLIKKVNKTYRYYLTSLGNHVINTALKIKELFIVQELSIA